jgi:nucleotide-binding universal stress UspA family protein
MHLSKILCPLDFSAASGPLLAYAAALAGATGAELSLLHVQELQPALSEAEVPGAAVELARYQLLAEQAGAPHVTIRLRRGEASCEIVREAQQQQHDLIVIGAHGQTGLTRFLMGNTAEHVVRTAPCATLLVKPQAGATYRQSA